MFTLAAPQRETDGHRDEDKKDRGREEQADNLNVFFCFSTGKNHRLFCALLLLLFQIQAAGE